MIIAIDFDGTCVSHSFPDMGKEIGAPRVLKKLIESGHQLILFTMRCDHECEPKSTDPEISNIFGTHLQTAVDWFKKHDIPLYGIQKNPTQDSWTSSPKCYAHLYIDDAALGCPLRYNSKISERPFVDWKKVEKLLIKQNII